MDGEEYQWRHNLQFSDAPPPETLNPFDSSLLIQLQDLLLQDPLANNFAFPSSAAAADSTVDSAAVANASLYDPFFVFQGPESGSGSGFMPWVHDPRCACNNSPAPRNILSAIELEKLRILSAVRDNVVNPIGPRESGLGLGLGLGLGSSKHYSDYFMSRNFTNGCEGAPIGPRVSGSGSGLGSLFSARNGIRPGRCDGFDIDRIRMNTVSSTVGYCIHHCNMNMYTNYSLTRKNKNRSSRKFNTYSIEPDDLRGKVSSYAKDQHWSPVLKHDLVKYPIEVIVLMISEVKEDIKEIIKNKFGTKFFQALVDFFDDSDITHVLQIMMATQQDFLDLSLDAQATRSVQKIIKKLDIDNEEQKSIVSSIVRGVTVTLSKDAAGYHVVEELMKTFCKSNDIIEPIMRELTKHCLDIAKNKNGCCLLQNCQQYVQGETLHRLLFQVIYYTFELSQHEYGNYVVQYVIGLRNYHYTTEIMNRLWGHMGNFSRNKYGSHVVEKCLNFGTDEQAQRIINELLGDEDHFLRIIQDSFGNFVAQAAIARAESSQGLRSMLRDLDERIQSHHASLQSHCFGINVLARLKCVRHQVGPYMM